MKLNTFIRLYQQFLKESEHKGWMIEVLREEFGNYQTSIKNKEGVEVQFFIKLDLENTVQLSETTHQSRLNYGVIRQVEEAELFAKEVMGAFRQCWAKHSKKRKSIFLYKP